MTERKIKAHSVNNAPDAECYIDTQFRTRQS